uniref:Uncharacterized protein n=2 Tax=Picea TaxID=3328 RepID=A0A101LYN3_PICGL|nr:hypothetical protein ABT39_MTgene4766 [Picea glauca]
MQKRLLPLLLLVSELALVLVPLTALVMDQQNLDLDSRLLPHPIV